MRIYWKIISIDGQEILRTITYANTLDVRRRTGQTLRRVFPASDGYSVRRVTVHSAAQSAADTTDNG